MGYSLRGLFAFLLFSSYLADAGTLKRCEDASKEAQKECKDAKTAASAESDKASSSIGKKAPGSTVDPGAAAMIAGARASQAAWTKGKQKCTEAQKKCEECNPGTITDVDGKKRGSAKTEAARERKACKDKTGEEQSEMDKGLASADQAEQEALATKAAADAAKPPGGEPPPGGAPKPPPGGAPKPAPGGGNPPPGGGGEGKKEEGGGGGMPPLNIPPLQPPEEKKEEAKKADPVKPIGGDVKPPGLIDCTNPNFAQNPKCKEGPPGGFRVASVCGATSSQRNGEACDKIKVEAFCEGDGRAGVCPSCREGMTADSLARVSQGELQKMCNSNCVSDPQLGPNLADRCRSIIGGGIGAQSVAGAAAGGSGGSGGLGTSGSGDVGVQDAGGGGSREGFRPGSIGGGEGGGSEGGSGGGSGNSAASGDSDDPITRGYRQGNRAPASANIRPRADVEASSGLNVFRISSDVLQNRCRNGLLMHCNVSH